jgi:hypothetical protein
MMHVFGHWQGVTLGNVAGRMSELRLEGVEKTSTNSLRIVKAEAHYELFKVIH